MQKQISQFYFFPQKNQYGHPCINSIIKHHQEPLESANDFGLWTSDLDLSISDR